MWRLPGGRQIVPRVLNLGVRIGVLETNAAARHVVEPEVQVGAIRGESVGDPVGDGAGLAGRKMEWRVW